MFYEKAWKQIVQPIRTPYTNEKVFPVQFEQKGHKIIKTTLKIPASDSTEIMFLQIFQVEGSKVEDLVIYMHSFDGDAREGNFMFDYFFPEFQVMLFDMRGCGNNTSEFVTLGLRESMDLAKILKVIKENYGPINIYLWGRQMGSAAIMHLLYDWETQLFIKSEIIKSQSVQNNAQQINDGNDFSKMQKSVNDHQKELLKLQSKCVLKYDDIQSGSETQSLYDMIQAVIYDSLFTNSKELIKQILKQNQNIGSIMAKLVMVPAKVSIKHIIGFDVLGHNKPGKKVFMVQKPALFMIGEDDQFIKFKDFKEMFDDYGSVMKNLRLLIDSSHKGQRDIEDIKAGYQFFYYFYQMKKQQENPQKLTNLYDFDIPKDLQQHKEKRRQTILQMEPSDEEHDKEENLEASFLFFKQMEEEKDKETKVETQTYEYDNQLCIKKLLKSLRWNFSG